MAEKNFDRSLLIPIALAVCSALGILAVLFGLRISARRADLPTTATSTPLQFQFLATEPGIVYPTVPTEGLPTPSPTAFESVTEETPTVGVIDFFTSTPVFGGATLSPTPTVLLLGRTYDDADFTLNYTGSWVGQSGVNGVYQNTLHLSNAIGDAVQLSFVGQKIRFVFQAGPSLGTVAIKLDSVDFVLDQSATETQAGEWESPLLVLSSHTITITHISGGSINIDALVIVDVSTATPSITPTNP